MSDRSWKRAFCCGLAAALTLCGTAPAGATQVIGDGVRPICDEAYYATTDYYGNLTNGSVVKSYALNGATSLTDYGTYEEVVNLSDGTAPIRRDEQLIFRFGDTAPTHFYFEGKTKAPFEALPWTLAVRYQLNGVPTKAEDLAGRTGLVEIDVDATPNPDASEYARYNYILTAAAIFNQEDILSLEAPGAQTQLIGNLRTVLFLAFPGEEQHFVIRVGADSFSFDGLTFMLMPATLSQLDEIAKLSEKKTDLEDSYHELSDSLDTVLDTFHSMQGSLYQTADGLDQLEQARRTVSGGKGQVYADLDKLQIDLETLSGALSPVTRHAQEAQAFLTDGRNAVNRFVDTVVKLNGNLSGLETSLKDLESGMGRMEAGLASIEEGLAGTEQSLIDVETALEDASSGLDDVASSLTAVDTGLAELEIGLENAEEDLSKTETGLVNLETGLEALETNMEKLEGGLQELEGGNSDVKRILTQMHDLQLSLTQLGNALDESGLPSRPSGSASDSAIGLTQSDLDNVQTIGALYDLTENGRTPNEAAFYAAMLSAQGRDDATVEQVAPLFASHNDAAIEAMGLTEAYQTLYALYRLPTFERFAAAMLLQRGYAQADAQSTAKQMDQLWTLYQTPEGNAALQLLLSSMGNIDRTINGATTSASRTLTDVSSMAANVMWDLSYLCKQIEKLTDMVDDAQTVSGILRDTSGDLRTLCASLRDTSGDLRTASADIRDLSGSLRDTSAAVREASGALQDSLQSLSGLLLSLTDASAQLRGTLSALRGTSQTLRDISSTARSASGKVRDTSAVIRAAISDADALRNVANAYEPSAQSALETLKNLTTIATTSIRDANQLIASAEGLLKRTGTQLDAGTRDTLSGLTTTIRQAADGMDSTKDLQAAKDTITDLIEDTWDDYTGDVNTLLLMDSTAEAQSLTSPDNAAPQSVQVLIRTQEIEVGDEEEETESVQKSTDGTFLSRLGQMFRDFWRAVTGIFH